MKNNKGTIALSLFIGIVIALVVIVGIAGWRYSNKPGIPAYTAGSTTTPVSVESVVDSTDISVTLYHYILASGEYQNTMQSIAPTSQIIDTTLKLLFQVYLPKLKSEYIDVSVASGIAIVNFKQGANAYLQAPPGIQAEYTNSIRKTLLQFGAIQEVEYAIDGQVITGWDA